MKQNHTIREIIHELEARVRSNRRWRVVATCLASVVVFTTVYLLVLPAITIQTSDDLSGAGIELTSVEDSQGSVTNSGVQPLAEGDVTSGDVTSGDVPADDASSATQPGSDGGASTGDGGTTGDSATTDDGAAANDGTQDVSQPSGSTGETTPQPEGGSSADVAGEATPNQPASNDGAETLSSGDDASTFADITDTVIVEGSIEGTSLTWAITENDLGERTLTVEGDGAIPDYSHTTTTPWYNQALKKLTNIVIGDGVTAIGRNAFSSLYATGGLTIGKNVTTIGANALDRNNFSEPVVIPGSVQAIGDQAFRDCNMIPELIFEESQDGARLTTFSTIALANALSSEATVRISSTVEQFYASSCNAQAYVVDDNNPNYASAEGVLYLRNKSALGMADDTYTIIKYPAYKDEATYSIPDVVTAIQSQAFNNVYRLTKLVIPDKENEDTRTVTVPSRAFQNSKIQEIVLGTRADLANMDSLFADNSMLQKVEIHDGVDCGTTLNATYSGNSLLSEATIPASITSMNDNAFFNCISLYRLTYDARNMTSFPAAFGAGRLNFTLVVGENVDTVGEGFDIIGRYASDVLFAPNNTIEVAEGAFANLPDPLPSLSGTIHVDGNGVVYACDDDGTASLVYVPSTTIDGAPVTTATVPESITDSSGNQYTVDTVRRGALRGASNLTSIVFNKPENIILLETNALANCPTLESVNGKTSSKDATSIFTNKDVSIGYGVFNNTKLTGSESGGNLGENMKGPQSLTVKRDGAPDMSIYIGEEGSTLEWSGSSAQELGGWNLLTGDPLNLQVTLGDTGAAADHVYRVFIHYTRDSHSLTPVPGDYSYGGIPTTCYATTDPYTYCVEFKLAEVGQTVNIPMVLSYTNGSAGGGAMVWGEIGTETLEDQGYVLESGAVDANRAIAYPDNENAILYAFWSTKPDYRKVVKTSQTQNNLPLTSSGDGGATISEPLVWNISHNAESTEQSEFGKDYATYYEVAGSLSLPEHVKWSDAVIRAIRSGDVITDTINPSGSIQSTLLLNDGTRILSVSAQSSTAKGLQVTLDGDDPRFSFYFSNVNGTPVGSDEISYPRWTVTVYPEALYIDLDAYSTSGGSRDVTNKVTSTIHYHYNEPHETESEASITLGESDARLVLEKDAPKSAYLGEEVNYTLTLSNQGAVPWDGGSKTGDVPAPVYRVEDTLSQNTFITPENIEQLFQSIPHVPDPGDWVTDIPKSISLEVKIENASLAEWKEVYDVNSVGATNHAAYQTVGNSDDSEFDGGVTRGHTLILRKNEQAYSLQIDNGEAKTGPTIADLLRDAGYAVTQDATYTCTWYLNTAETRFYLQEGHSVEFVIPASAKTSFEVLGDDWWHEYDPDAAIGAVNTALVTDSTREEGDPWSKASTTTELRREARVDKWANKNGVSLGDEVVVGQGDILDYQVEFIHYGEGGYTNLPFVDDIYGTQALLVPVQGNDELANRGLEEIEGCYILNKPGTYANVLVGVDETGKTWNAAKVVVTEDSSTVIDGEEYSGLHTEIKWYHSQLKGGEYRIELNYQTYVDVSLNDAAAGELRITNTIWINDKTDRRIYDVIYGDGSIVSPEKEIVTALGDENDPGDDTIEESGHTVIDAGDEVIYRLTLDNYNSRDFTVVGTAMADALPKTYGMFKWKRTDADSAGRVQVKLVWESEESKGTATGIDKWTIEDEYAEGGLAPDEGQTYICWPEDTEITIPANSKAYLYVTLRFPGEKTDDVAIWNRYTNATGGATLTNTFWLYRQSARVTHEVDEPGYVLLQKGVYSTLVAGTQVSDRSNYSNSANGISGVVYYVLVYNAGNKRLYLNDIKDTLPAGFAYNNLVPQRTSAYGANVQSIVTMGGKQGEAGIFPHATVDSTVYDIKQDVEFRSARVSASASGNKLTFAIAENPDAADEYAVKSDELGCYLDRNEAIEFGYTCYSASDTTKTDDVANNVAGMEYVDYLSSGMFVATSNAAKEAGIEVSAEAFRGAQSGLTFDDLNDGTCESLPASQAAGDGYNLDASGENSWLVSAVKLRRGGIKPGAGKVVASYTEHDSTTELEYTNSVSPTATINWAMRGYNEGTQIINDYTLSDTMPHPYTFVGPVSMNVYDAAGRIVYNDPSGPLFSIERHEPDQPFEITGRDNTTFTIDFANNENVGTWLQVIKSSNNFFVRFTQNEDGDEVMSVKFSYYQRSIPGDGCYAEVTFSSVNATNKYENTVFTNTSTFSPNVQDFDASNKGEGTFLPGGGEEGKNAVQASASVNVSLGSSTSSLKTVTELDASGSETKNSATSQDANSTITLSNQDAPFRYSLSVTNDSNNSALEKLVFIDSLPAEGDHSPFSEAAKRNSDFGVHIDNLDSMKVEVRDAEGALIRELLREGQTSSGTQPGGEDGSEPIPTGTYRLDVRTDENPVFDSSDWSGDNGTEWQDCARYAGKIMDISAIRIVIEDTNAGGDAAWIPAGATVHVSFDAKADAGALPAEVAVNSFGYHYVMSNVSTELEAMPGTVSVRVPSAPELQKRIVDRMGSQKEAKADSDFHFVVYSGERIDLSSLSGSAPESYLEDLRAKLFGRKWRIIRLAVEEGMSESETLQLTNDAMDDKSGTGHVIAKSDDSPWSWAPGEAYNVFELPTGEDYSFNRFNNSNADTLTFRYDRSMNQVITCENISNVWSINIKKVDGLTNLALEGSVFGLYSPNSEDQMSDDEFDKIDDELKGLFKRTVQPEVVGATSTTYYLTAVADMRTTNEHTWSELSQANYYVLEVKAPNGYALPSSGELVYRASDTDQDGLVAYTAKNYNSFLLPSTGGPGTTLFTLGGVALMGAACIAGYRKRSRKGDGPCC